MITLALTFLILAVNASIYTKYIRIEIMPVTSETDNCSTNVDNVPMYMPYDGSCGCRRVSLFQDSCAYVGLCEGSLDGTHVTMSCYVQDAECGDVTSILLDSNLTGELGACNTYTKQMVNMNISYNYRFTTISYVDANTKAVIVSATVLPTLFTVIMILCCYKLYKHRKNFHTNKYYKF